MVMNSNYLQEHTHLLERLFSFAYENDYSCKALEKDISRSLYFQSIEKDYEAMPPVVDDNSLARAIFVDPTIDLNKVWKTATEDIKLLFDYCELILNEN